MRPKFSIGSDYGAPAQRPWMSASRRGTGSSVGPKILLVAVVVVAGVIGISGIFPQVIDADRVPEASARLPKMSLSAPTTKRSGIVAFRYPRVAPSRRARPRSRPRAPRLNCRICAPRLPPQSCRRRLRSHRGPPRFRTRRPRPMRCRRSLHQPLRPSRSKGRGPPRSRRPWWCRRSSCRSSTANPATPGLTPSMAGRVGRVPAGPASRHSVISAGSEPLDPRSNTRQASACTLAASSRARRLPICRLGPLVLTAPGAGRSRGHPSIGEGLCRTCRHIRLGN